MTIPVPLFRRFPLLAAALPCLSIGDFPTPVDRLKGLSLALRRKNLFIKRDDISGPVYGGNKVRKLSFLLADAKKQGAVRVITTGAAGSNHALATALYAMRAGLGATLVLGEQPPSQTVRDNLLADAFTGAEMVYEGEYHRTKGTIERLVEKHTQSEGRAPYVIPAGGSSEVGAIGFVNAGFELGEQVENGEIDEPVAVVVALGTMGTAAGLLLGLKAAGLKTRVVAVRVVPPVIAGPEKFRAFFESVNAFLRQKDPSFPMVDFSDSDFSINDDYFEPGYGSASKEVLTAIAALERTDATHLDMTYSGKAFAAFYDLAGEPSGGDGPLLFWNTKNSRELPEGSKKIDYRSLPEGFHKYFNASY